MALGASKLLNERLEEDAEEDANDDEGDDKDVIDSRFDMWLSCRFKGAHVVLQRPLIRSAHCYPHWSNPVWIVPLLLYYRSGCHHSCHGCAVPCTLFSPIICVATNWWQPFASFSMLNLLTC